MLCLWCVQSGALGEVHPHEKRSLIQVKGSSLASSPDALVCPRCEAGRLRLYDKNSMRCQSCGGHLSGVMVEVLQQITALPDAIGAHACEECAHPQMRRLPDGTFHCPSCGSEVVPLGAPPVDWKCDERSEAYWAGWLEGRFGRIGSFADNTNLAEWELPSERLDYYWGHRAGSEIRQARIGRKP